MDWKVLGIDPTTEKEVIEAAYNEKLNYIDLENRPEEFELLHKAYLEALSFADTPTAAEKIASDAKDYDFRSAFSTVYDDFSLRISPDTWKNLLDRYEGLLGEDRAEAELIDCLMDRHILPQIVWKYLDERYRFDENNFILADIGITGTHWMYDDSEAYIMSQSVASFQWYSWPYAGYTNFSYPFRAIESEIKATVNSISSSGTPLESDKTYNIMVTLACQKIDL